MKPKYLKHFCNSSTYPYMLFRIWNFPNFSSMWKSKCKIWLLHWLFWKDWSQLNIIEVGLSYLSVNIIWISSYKNMQSLEFSKNNLQEIFWHLDWEIRRKQFLLHNISIVFNKLLLGSYKLFVSYMLWMVLWCLCSSFPTNFFYTFTLKTWL